MLLLGDRADCYSTKLMLLFYSKRHNLTQDSLEPCDRRYRFYFILFAFVVVLE